MPSMQNIKWLNILWAVGTRYWPILYVWLWSLSAQGMLLNSSIPFFPSWVWLATSGLASVTAILLVIMPRSLWHRASMLILGLVAMGVRIYALIHLAPSGASAFTTFLPSVGWICWCLALIIWTLFSAFLIHQGNMSFDKS